MTITEARPFTLERYFARYEFCTKHILCGSDCESMTIRDVLAYELDPNKALDDMLDIKLGYTEAQGDPLLREQIAKLYSVPADNIVVCTGAVEPLLLFSMSCLSTHDHVIVQYPCYQALEEGSLIRNCHVKHWQMRHNDDTHEWYFDIDELQRMMEETPIKALIFNCPHNPSGWIPTPAQYKQIIAVCRKHNVILYSDEVYKYLEYDQADALPNAVDVYENAISMNVMTKSFGLPGLRIGWVASHNVELLEKISRVKDYTTICNSAPSEYLSRIALKHYEKIIQRSRNIISRNLVLADEFFAKHQELFEWNRPRAGPIAFIKLKQGSARDFCDKLVKDAGILLLPSYTYHVEELESFRFGFGRENFPEMLQAFDQYLFNMK
jgi:aspartate/methionine/tyrosine aminotransferase